MESDEEQSLGSRADTVPFQDWQKILSGGRQLGPGARNATPALPRPAEREPRQPDGGGSGGGGEPPRAPLARSPLGVRRASLLDRAGRTESHISLQNSAFNENDSLEPDLHIGVGAQLINEDKYPPNNQPVDDAAIDRPRGGIHHSVSTTSGLSRVDHEVIITGEAAEASVPLPTPLGHPRRLSLFERANSASPISVDIVSDGVHDVPDRSVRSCSMISKGEDIYTDSHEDKAPRGHDPSPRYGQYNTIQRDWLMHVLEKDDRQDAHVRIMCF